MVVYQRFQFGRVKNLSFGKGLQAYHSISIIVYGPAIKQYSNTAFSELSQVKSILRKRLRKTA